MAGARTRARVVIVTNPRSGGGKTARYGLVQRAEDMGAQVWMTSAERDAVSLARNAVREGAQVLGVAGGDGTVSAVAAVAADEGRPLVVVPAGTRNHFARDLGLDLRDPGRALNALVDGDPAQVDLGVLGPRVFVNNVSFGMYADALLEPGYREDKPRAFAAVAPDRTGGCVGREAPGRDPTALAASRGSSQAGHEPLGDSYAEVKELITMTNLVGFPERPVRVNARIDSPLSRWLWLVKWILAIPHYVVLFFLWIAFTVVTVIAFFAILFTERYPRALFDFNLGVLRWSWRVSYYSYDALGTDRYPPFSLGEEPDYPAQLDIAYPERLSRGLVLVKWWLLAIPHYMVIGFFLGGAHLGWWSGGLIALLTVIAAVILTFTEKYPKDLFDLIIGLNRWVLRVTAYATLMTDQYPPFRLDLGGTETTSPEERA